MQKRNMRNQKGFTLVEIAIVLVIVGLLIGGILKGTEMIKNAKMKKVITTADGVRASVNTYLDKVGNLPGDDTGGVFDGQINSATQAFSEMAAENVVNGSAVPKDPYGGDITIGYFAADGLGAGSSAGNWIGFPGAGADSEAPALLDSKYDDGAATTGSMIVSGTTLYVPL